jgi:gamma-glutamylcyclotransferase (GGCT)/AIG2-like uncharacterized protein YtfP
MTQAVDEAFVFTYGTLMSEKVLQAVLGRVPQHSPGELDGYVRCPLGNNRCYPGAIPRQGSTLRGRVLRYITSLELAVLDRYEGDEYDRACVDGVRLETGETVRARFWPLADLSGVLDGEWSYDAFIATNEASYVKMCTEWAHDDQREQQQCTPERRGAK